MKKSLSWIVLLLSLSVLSACGGGGGGGAAGLQPPSAHLAGTWQWTEVEGTNTCGDDPLYTPDTLWTGIVTHATGSNTLSVLNTTAIPNETFAGTISGSSISMSGVRSAGTGTSTFTFSGSVDGSGTIVSGTSSWTWAGSGTSCSGTTQVVAGLGTGSVRVINNSALAVTEVYLTPHISNYWGSNRIVSDISAGGGTITFSGITLGYYDFDAVMSNATERYVINFTLPAGTMPPTVTITIPN